MLPFKYCTPSRRRHSQRSSMFMLLQQQHCGSMMIRLLLSLVAVAAYLAPSAVAVVPRAEDLLPRAHVINLQHRPERLKAFEDHVQAIMPRHPRLFLDYSVLRASNTKDAQEAIDSGIVRFDPQWADRVGNGLIGRRTMTLGEVGCALSHVRAWHSIAEELGSSSEKYAIVFEDDAVISLDFPERIGGVVASAVKNNADFVYLAYRGSDTNERIEVDEHLQTCVANWWAIAYMISGSAATKLASSSKAYLQNLIPVDDYFPIILTNKEGWGEDFPETRLNCFTVKGEQLAQPYFDRNEGVSDTEKSEIALAQTLVGGDTQLLIFTVATDSDHFGYQSLRRSAGYFGHTLINLGEGKKWGGYNTKLVLMKEALEQITDDDQLVLFVDGYNTIFQRGPEEIIARFENLVENFQQQHGEDSMNLYHGAVFFGAEHNCWPSEQVCAQYEEGTEYSSPYSYLNSGTYIGRAGLIRALLEDVHSRPDEDDQLYLSKKLVHYVQSGAGVPIVLDGERLLFHALLNSEPDWTIDEGDDGYYWLYQDDVIPAVLHGQGPAKNTLIGISNYIPGAFTDFYGPLRHTHMQTANIYPLSIGLFFVEQTDIDQETQFLASIKSLNIDRSQTQVFVYSISDRQMHRVCPIILDSQYANCVNTNETDEALARADFLTLAAESGAHSALMVDSDVIVARASVVHDLAGWSRPVVIGHAHRPEVSNYWTDMDHWPGGQQYRRGFDALSLYARLRRGLFQIPFGRGLFLIQNTELERLAGIFAEEAGSKDDTVRRACLAATDAGLGIYVDNRYDYASLFVADEDDSAAHEEELRSSPRPLLQCWDNIFSPTALANVLSGIECRNDPFDSVIDRQSPPRSTVESAILSVLSQLNDNSRYVEYWVRELPVDMAAHRDIDEVYAKKSFSLGSDSQIGEQRCPKNGHVLYVNVEDEFGSPTLLWDEEEGVEPGPPGKLKSVWAVPSVSNRLLRFNGNCFHAVAYPPLSYLKQEEADSEDSDDSSDDDDLVGKRAVILFNTWDDPPMPSDDTYDGAVLALGTMLSEQEITQYKEVKEQSTVCQDIGKWRPTSTTMLENKSEQECVDDDSNESSSVLSIPLLGSYPRHGHESESLKMLVKSAQIEKAFTSRYNIYGVEQSGSISQDGIGDDDMTWNGLLQATLAVIVSVAGSSEANGCYILKGRNGNAWEFELDNAAGRTFEMFKVEGSGWWNIMERVGDSYPNPVHYGVEGDSDDVLPPTDGWGSFKYKDSWLGMDPMPNVEVADRKACLSSWKKGERASLAEG